jgi:hypothetical protein
MRVYIITQQNLREEKSSIYGIYSNKNKAKNLVDKLNNRYNPSLDEEDEGMYYTLTSEEVDDSSEEDEEF